MRAKTPQKPIGGVDEGFGFKVPGFQCLAFGFLVVGSRDWSLGFGLRETLG